MFNVSVIIPVFNAASYVKQAVNSAVNLSEVGEIILVEDGSKDNSFEVCQEIEKDHFKVSLIRHPNGENRGAGASRNLGISCAKFDYVAFLDADDWYAANRFEKDQNLFQTKEISAAYSLSAVAYPNGKTVLFGYNKDLKEVLPNNDKLSQYRYILENDLILGHTNCNTFRKSIFENIKGFDERLELHQDTELWNRIARNYGFHSGNLESPISFARRHSENRITHKSRKSLLKLQLVYLDNIGLLNLYDFEKNYVVYQIARAISNSINNHFIRKTILHSFQWVIKPFKGYFIKKFYFWGMGYFRLQK